MTDHDDENHECPVCNLTNELLDVIEQSPDQHPILILQALSNATATIISGISIEPEEPAKGNA